MIIQRISNARYNLGPQKKSSLLQDGKKRRLRDGRVCSRPQREWQNWNQNPNLGFQSSFPLKSLIRKWSQWPSHWLHQYKRIATLENAVMLPQCYLNKPQLTNIYCLKLPQFERVFYTNVFSGLAGGFSPANLARSTMCFYQLREDQNCKYS